MVADITQASTLIEDLSTRTVIGDRGYDADTLEARIHAAGAQAVILPRRNRTEPRVYDRPLYKDRNLVEHFFNRLKQFRRIATRYEKLAQLLVHAQSCVPTFGRRDCQQTLTAC